MVDMEETYATLPYSSPPSDTDLDFSFTSTITDPTLTSSTTSGRSSLNLSFNDRLSTTSTALHHRRNDPHWASIKTATNHSSEGKLHLRHLKLVRHLGSGNLGRVFLCNLRDCSASTSFALKVIDRNTLTKKKISHVETESEILSLLDHPFLPTLYARLDVSHYTCLLIDYCSNGDLYTILHKQPGNRLPLRAVKFFAAEVLVAIEYLHALGIVYRDLKPENILLREDGHIMLSDFDLCFKADVAPTFRAHKKKSPRLKHTRSCSTSRKEDEEMVEAEFVAEPTGAFSSSCVGTHEYLAPELLSGNGHGNEVDWWAFGVLIYELLYGTTPFKGASKEVTLRNIASNNKNVRFQVAQGGVYEDEEELKYAKDLIERLLVKDPRRRLGCVKGATDIKRHRFFDGIKWPLIRHYKLPELRGLEFKKEKSSRASHVISLSIKRRRSSCLWWWSKGSKGTNFFTRNQKNYSGVKSNSKYYCHSNSNTNSNYYCYKTKQKYV